MSQRFSYVRYDALSAQTQGQFKDAFERLEELAESTMKPGRAKALFLTALEETYMWTGKAIRDGQITRQGKVDEQPERNAE